MFATRYACEILNSYIKSAEYFSKNVQEATSGF